MSPRLRNEQRTSASLWDLVLVEIFVGDVIRKHFVGEHFFVGIVGFFDALHDSSFERIALFQ